MSKYSRKKIYKKVGRLIRRKGLEILLIFLIVIASFLSGILFNKLNSLEKNITSNSPINFVSSEDLSKIQNKVLKDKYIFKIKWGDLAKRMVEDGVIDKVKLAQAIGGEDELPKDLDKYFTGDQNKVEVNQGNAQFWVDVLWGLGLANKNKILEKGEMMASGNASNFASTGGWTIGVKKPMDIYSKHTYINLSAGQQIMVE